MRHGLLAVLLCLLGLLLAQPLVAAEAKSPARSGPSPEAVDAAIKKAIAFLYKQQKGDNWETVAHRDPREMAFMTLEHERFEKDKKEGKASGEGPTRPNHAGPNDWQWGGASALAICALLYAGESQQNPKLAAGIEWLKRADMYGIYAMGFRCQVWAMIPNNETVRRVALRDRNYLLAAVHQNPEKEPGRPTGLFPYYFFEGRRGSSDEWYDHSVSQYGILGMWAISQLNLETPLDFWRVSEMAWRHNQYPDGGWSYRHSDSDKNQDWTKGTVAMTAAGLASLFITQEMLHSMDGLRCTGNYRDESIERAIQWMHANFRRFEEHHPYYSLYGVERIGVASGLKYFGNLNWYEVGAEYLLKRQNSDGSWGGDDGHHNIRKIPDTAFALMFLARGRAPVMMNKLEYVVDMAGDRPRPATWNERPREVANISRWVGRQIERDLNWQIVNLDAPVDELHDSPILWISGKDPLSFKDTEVAKLKQFVEEGGLILGNADCGNVAFAVSFRKLGQKMFPQYEFRELPSSHPIYANQQFRRKGWRQPPFLQGLSNGARELMLLFPIYDPASGWQTQSWSGTEREPLSQVGANIFLYAVDKKNLRFKGESFLVYPDPKINPKGTIKVARLEYPGNWDPESAGWRRMRAIMRNTHRTDLTVESVKLGGGKLTAGGYAAAHLTGTAKTTLSQAAQAELKKFVEGGGTLIVDAAGGSPDFAISIEPTLRTMFGATGMKTLRPNHPVLAGPEKVTIEYRAYARKTLGNLRTSRIQGVEVGGKTRVFFSGEDLSAGLVGQPVDGIHGYEPEVAAAIVGNILMHAAGK